MDTLSECLDLSSLEEQLRPEVTKWSRLEDPSARHCSLSGSSFTSFQSYNACIRSSRT